MNMISVRFAGLCFLSFSVFSLDIFAKEEYSILVRYLWARGSAGRAPRSQRGGRGFEPLRVHQTKKASFRMLFCTQIMCGFEHLSLGMFMDTAVYHEGLPGQVAAVFTCKENNQRCTVFFCGTHTF